MTKRKIWEHFTIHDEGFLVEMTMDQWADFWEIAMNDQEFLESVTPDQWDEFFMWRATVGGDVDEAGQIAFMRGLVSGQHVSTETPIVGALFGEKFSDVGGLTSWKRA